MDFGKCKSCKRPFPLTIILKGQCRSCRGLNPMNIDVRIRKIYFDDMVAGKKKFELRADSDHWRRRFGNGKVMNYSGGILTARCGPRICSWRIRFIDFVNAEERLGRQLSEQGKKDVGTGMVWSIELGDEIKSGS